MPYIYTVFPLTSSTTVNLLTIKYESTSESQITDQEYLDKHLIELRIYVLPQLTFADFTISEIKAGGLVPKFSKQYLLNKIPAPKDFADTFFTESPRPQNYQQLRSLFRTLVNTATDLHPK